MSLRILVFPAASNPNINIRISFDPKILLIIFDTEPPMLPVFYVDARSSDRDRSHSVLYEYLHNVSISWIFSRLSSLALLELLYSCPGYSKMKVPNPRSVDVFNENQSAESFRRTSKFHETVRWCLELCGRWLADVCQRPLKLPWERPVIGIRVGRLCRVAPELPELA